ncbi:hypothetical protein H4582DRAFT_779992 [Lactarius indigo]|nr:hypothetical protein H4582DRAFT_779992 [Lactarius indigo]
MKVTSTHKIKHHTPHLILSMAPGLFFRCTWKWRRKRRRRWPRTGKRMPTGSSYSSTRFDPSGFFQRKKSQVKLLELIFASRALRTSVLNSRGPRAEHSKGWIGGKLVNRYTLTSHRRPLHFFRWLRRSVATYLSPIFSTTFPSEDIIRRRWLPLLPAHVVHDYPLHLIRPLLSKERAVQWKEALLAPLRGIGKYYGFHGSSTNVAVTSLATDVAIAGPSLCSLSAEDTGDHQSSSATFTWSV